MIPAEHTIRLIDLKNDPNIVETLEHYTIYDEQYRNTLNNKILNHYAYEEIGFETPFMFAHYLKIKLDEIMPKYNKLYTSEILKIDPLANFYTKETMDKDLSGSASSNSSSSNTGDTTQNEKSVFQNTPQGNLHNETIENFSYATNITLDGNSKHNTSSSTLQDSTNTSSTEDYIKTIIGTQNVSTTKLFNEYVQNFTSIDKLIIDELQDLFMGIY